MTCRDATDVLDRYLDGDLPARQQLSLKLHLLLCRDCRNYLRSYELTIRAAKAAICQELAPTPTTLCPHGN